jgi:hypothetical protein
MFSISRSMRWRCSTGTSCGPAGTSQDRAGHLVLEVGSDGMVTIRPPARSCASRADLVGEARDVVLAHVRQHRVVHEDALGKLLRLVADDAIADE